MTFITNAHVGVNVPVESLTEHYDAILLCGGAEQPRDLPIPGRELKGIHFAMEFLPQQNRRNEGDAEDALLASMGAAARFSPPASACSSSAAATPAPTAWAPAIASSAKSVHQFEIMPKPPAERSPLTPWPLWPLQLRTESAHEEGGIRDWSINSVKFTGDEHGNVKQLHAVRVGPPPKFEAIPGSEFTMDVDLVLLAMGFLGPVRNGMIEQLGLELDNRGNVATDELHDLDGRHLRRRRHAPRPVAGGLGHRRRPQSRRSRE